MGGSVRSAIWYLDINLLHLRHWVRSKRGLEFGDPAQDVNAVLNRLKHACDYFQSELQAEYTLDRHPLKTVNLYFNVNRATSQTIAWAETIQRRGVGSSDQTYELEVRLNQCLSELAELATAAELTLFPHEVSWEVLRARLEELEPNHPAREQFDELLRQLALEWVQPDRREEIVEEIGRLAQDHRLPQKPSVAILTALPEEYAAVQTMIDNGKESFTQSGKADEHYYCGEMPAAQGGMHQVVLSMTVSMGTNIASVWATNLLQHFPDLRVIIMVGIAGGVPNPQKPNDHVRLGDVVVSGEQGVVQYDFIKQEGDEIKVRNPPRPPSPRLLHAAKRLAVGNIQGRREWIQCVERASKLRGVAYPGDEQDVLHRFARTRTGSLVKKGVIPHPADPEHHPGEPRVFIGTIGSSNTLQKDPFKRDTLRDKYGVKAIEMEGSGVADATWVFEKDYLVVRGVCDYCDPAKNDQWHGYASVAAAAYTRALLECIPAPSNMD